MSRVSTETVRPTSCCCITGTGIIPAPRSPKRCFPLPSLPYCNADLITALGMHGEHPPNPKKPHDQSQGDEKDQGKSPDQQSGGIIFSKYLKDHLLPQIYFDLWPIFIGVMFICVMERHKILDSDDFGWLNLFQILFEGVSGYATVGLSYGNP